MAFQKHNSRSIQENRDTYAEFILDELRARGSVKRARDVVAAIKTVAVRGQMSNEDAFEAACEKMLDAGWEFIAAPTFHCAQDAEHGMTTYRFASFAIDPNLL